MSIIWYNEEPKEIVVTITPMHLTINKPGKLFFETANQVMLGYDKAKKLLVIKPLSKGEVIRGDIPEHSRYNVSTNASYARITNKSFIARITEIFNLDLGEKGTKFKTVWKSSDRALEINLTEVL